MDQRVERRMISPRFVEDALDCMRRRGMEVEPLLRSVGLPEKVTEPVSAESYGALWLAISQAMEDEFFGGAAQPMRPGSFTLLCHAVLYATTLEQALRRALRFLNVVLADPRGELVVADGLALVRLTDKGGPRSAFTYRTYWILVHGITCWLVGRRIPLRRLEFSCDPPRQSADYGRFFGAPVHFSQPQSLLAFDASFLTLPAIRNEKALKEFLRRAPANILVRYRHDAGLAARVRTRLQETPPMNWPDAETMAKRLRMPASSLRRRLREEGTTYRDIRDELRRDLAMEWLLQSTRGVGEVAADLGFSEPSAFHRAFRKWTGMRPGAFRRAGGMDGTDGSGASR